MKMNPSRLNGVVVAVVLLAQSASAQDQADPAAGLFAAGRILQIEVEMAPADWREVRTSHRDGSDSLLSRLSQDGAYAYRPATITIDGVRVARVGVRKKGLIGSVVSTRPSLKIKFDEFVDDQTFLGLDGLTLNNNNQDQTLVQSYLAYDLFRRAGVPAPRASFAHVRVNGEDLGVYTNLEGIDKPFLRRVFGSSNGVLYESYAGDFVGGFGQIVEKSGGRRQDRSRLGALGTVLSDAGPVSVARIGELIDLDTFMRMWAVESLMGHWDSYSGNRNNFYLYANPATRKLHFIPWGADALFEDPGPLQTAVVPKSFKAMGVLCQRLWELPEMRDRYRALMRELLDGPWTESRLLAEMTAMQKTLQPQSTLLPATMQAASARVAAFVATRRAQVEAELTAPGPSWPAAATPNGSPTPVVLTGSFTAPWSLDPPQDPFSRGGGQLTVEFGGRPGGAIEQTGAYAVTHKPGDPSPLALIREKYHNVTLTGRAGAQVWVLQLTIDPYRLEPAAATLPIDHFAVWAIVVSIDGKTPPRAGIFGNVGELRLDEAAVKDGGVLRGTFTVRGFLP